MFYFSYTGGKSKEFKYIKDIIEKCSFNKFIEPFCGSCATSLKLFVNKKDSIKYHCNDIDNKLIQLLKDIKENGTDIYFDYCKNIIYDESFNKEIHNKIVNKYKNGNHNLFEYFYYNKCYNYRRGLYPDQKLKKLALIKTKEHTLTDEFFKNCKLTHKNYMEILDKYKNDENALLYIDPPYLDSYNAYYAQYGKNIINDNENNIEIIDNTKMYIDIAEFIKKCKCKVIIILNENYIMKYLFEGYIKSKYKKVYQTSHFNKISDKYYKKYTNHLIISNIL